MSQDLSERRVFGLTMHFNDDTGMVTLTDEEEAEVMRLVKAADEVNNSINYDDLPSAFLNIYINSEIKSGSFLEDAGASFEGFINWYSQRVQKKINNLKSQKVANAQPTMLWKLCSLLIIREKISPIFSK